EKRQVVRDLVMTGVLSRIWERCKRHACGTEDRLTRKSVGARTIRSKHDSRVQVTLSIRKIRSGDLSGSVDLQAPVGICIKEKFKTVRYADLEARRYVAEVSVARIAI